MKGWGPKRSVCPSKPGKPNFFGGISWDFAGIRGGGGAKTLIGQKLRGRNGGGKQGRGNQPPYRRYRPDTEIQYRPRSHADLQNPAEFSPKGKPMRNFSIDPTSPIRTRSWTPFLRTPFRRLLCSILFPIEKAEFFFLAPCAGGMSVPLSTTLQVTNLLTW